MNKIKQKLRKVISITLVVVLLVTTTTYSGLTLQDAKAATAYYPTISFNLGKLSSPNSYVGNLTNDDKQAEMCSINLAGGPVFCMLLNGSLSMYDAFYTADIDSYGKSYQKYFRGAVYYYVDENDEFTLSRTERYVVSQIMLWRILQIRKNGKSGTYDNIMSGFESTFKGIINYWGECNADTAWNEIKQVMQWVNNDYEKVDNKHVTLYLWTHDDGTQPLLRGEVEPFEERAYIAVQKEGEIAGANVKGAEFGIYSKKGCSEDSRICKITTDKDGYAITSNSQAKKLKPNTTYFIKEIKAPAGSELNTEVFNVKTTENSTTTKKVVKITVSDEQYKIKINTVKVDKDNTSKKLSGAVFRVYQWNTSSEKYELYKDYTTGANGAFTTEWLYYTKTNTGKYRVEEIQAPAGYKLSGFKKDVQINENNTDDTVEYTAENEQYPGWIEIHKAAFLDDKDVSDEVNLTATFSIYSDAACTKYAGSITTNRSGFGKSGDLKEGTYYVKENKWTGRLKPSFKEGEKVEVKAQVTKQIYGEPGKLAGQTPDGIGIKLIKVDADNNLLAVKGAEFGIYEWNGVSWTLKYRATSNEAGLVEIPVEDNKLYYTEKNQGRFMVAELSAPPDYTLDPTPRYVTITDENANTTVDLGLFENTPKNGALEIQKIIADAKGDKVTDIPMNDSFLQITYGLYTDEAFNNPIDDSIELSESGHAKIENLPAGTYYLKETSYNKDIFAGTDSIDTRFIEITIKRNNTTYVDGEKGYSEDGKQWFDCWNNVVTASKLSMINDADSLTADGLIASAGTSEVFGVNEYQVVQETATEDKKTIKDVKDNWKELSDEELDKVLGSSEQMDIANFLVKLSDEDLDTILSKDTRLTEPYTTYKVVDEKGTLKKATEEIYWKYLMELPYMAVPQSSLNCTSGYFTLTVSGDGKTSNLTVGIKTDGTTNTDKSVNVFYTLEGSNNHNVQLTSGSGYTSLSGGGTDYNLVTMGISYTKTAHYVASAENSGIAITNNGTNTVCSFNNTQNNTGHKLTNVTERLQIIVNLINAGLLDYSGKNYHATLKLKLNKQCGGLKVNPNGGSWSFSGTTYTTNSYIVGHPCGWVSNIHNPTRKGYTFIGWSLSNGANAHGNLSGNLYGGTITNSAVRFTFGGEATDEVEASINGYYTTLTANWQVNPYEVTCIDVVGTSINGTELGRGTFMADYGTTTSGSIMGSDTGWGAYYEDYYYTGSTYATVTENGATVYRFFSKSPAAVTAPNVLKNILKTIELDIIKTDAENEAKTLDASFDVLEWSQSQGMYVPYLTGVKAQQRIALRLTFDNLGKYHVVETSVQNDYTMSQAEADISIYDDEAKEIPFYENTLGVEEDLGVFVNGRGYNRGDIVRTRADALAATYYRCLVANVGKNVTETTYWQRIRSTNYDRYSDLVNGAGEWNDGLKVHTVMAVQVGNTSRTPGTTSLSINKKNTTGNILFGAEFAVYYTDGTKCKDFELFGTQYKAKDINISDTQTYSTYDAATGIRTLNLMIKEESAPMGYIKAEGIAINVTIKSKLNTDNQWEAISITATFANGITQDISNGIAIDFINSEIKLNILLTKKATEGNLPVSSLSGAVYGIYDNAECTSLVDDVTIDSEGKAEIAGLTLKDYWIKEITAPTSGLYKLSDEVKQIKASELYDGTESVTAVNISVTVTDEPYLGEILINKFGYTDLIFAQAKLLEGAGFTLYELPKIPEGVDEEAYVQTYDFSKATVIRKEVKTDSNGVARFKDLPMGDYVVVETTVPDDFVKVENKVVHLTKEYIGNNDNTAYPLVLYDRPYGAPIRIYKVSSDDNKPLEGAVFKIFDVNANGYIAEKVYTTDEDGNEIESLEEKLYTTDEKGLITTESLREGTYRIEEVSAPDGYVLNETPVEVVIKQGSEAGFDEAGYPYFEVTMKNKPTDTYFKKIDITTKEEIKGGYYTVTDSFGNVVDEWEGTGVAHHIYGLVKGEEYTFTEKIAPDGYVLTESITFMINEDGTPTEIVMEDDYNKLEISKQDITTSGEIPGAHLQILDEDGNIVEEWISTTTPHRIDRIPVGTYTLKETQAPDGYLVSEEVEFTVGESTEIQKVVMYDDYTKTAFIKLAEDTQEPLAGCVLQVLDENGKVVDEWTTDGDVHYTYKLTKGETYTLHEVSAPDEYELAKDIKFVAGEKYISEEDKALQNGEITDKEGIGIDDDSYIKEEKDVKVTVENLIGSEGDEYADDGLVYAESEIVDVAGDTDDDTFDASEVVTVTMTDSPITILPEKVDENGNPVYGAVIQILDKDGNVVYEWETGVMQTPGFKVKPGTYTLHEVSAPAGYQKFEDVEVTITDRDVSVKLVDHTMTDTDVTVTMVDEFKNIKLPFTGGILLNKLIFALSLILLGTAILGMSLKRRNILKTESRERE